MYSETYKIKNRTVAKISTIFTIPIVIVALESVIIGVATLLAVGIFLTVLRTISYRITVEEDGIYRSFPQAPLSKSRILRYTNIRSVRPEPQQNLMEKQSEGDILQSNNTYFGGDIDGAVRIEKHNGEKVFLSSETPKKLATHINEQISESEQPNKNKSTTKTVN